jgi:hypothetical protein
MTASGGTTPAGFVLETTATRPEIAWASGLGAIVTGRSRMLRSDWSTRWKR